MSCTNLHEKFSIPQTRHELALWHISELKRLIHQDGGSEVTIIIMGNYGSKRREKDLKAMHFHYNRPVIDRDGLFRTKGETS